MTVQRTEEMAPKNPEPVKTCFRAPLEDLSEYQELKEAVKRFGQPGTHTLPVLATGVTDTERCHLVDALGADYRYKVIVTYDEVRAKAICEDMKLYDRNVFFYPAKDLMFFAADVHGSAIVSKRMETLKALIDGEPMTIVLSVEAGLDRLLPLSFLKSQTLLFAPGDVVDLDKLRRQLVALGYENASQVEGKGQFSIHGGIIDIFPLTEEVPYRIELWDDEIDTIRTFDQESQRSIETEEMAVIYPASEFVIGEKRKAEGIRKITAECDKQVKKLRSLMKTEEAARLRETVDTFKESLDIYGGSFGIDSYLSYFYPETVSFFEYFDDRETVFFLDEVSRIAEKCDAVHYEYADSFSERLEKGYILPGQMGILFDDKKMLAKVASMRTVLLSLLETKTADITVQKRITFSVQNVNPFNNNFELLLADIRQYKQENYKVIIVCASRSRAERLAGDLSENGLPAFYSSDLARTLADGEIMTVYGNLRRGFSYPLIRFVVISESDIFGAQKKKRKHSREKGKDAISSFSELHVGDYVIHENHGLGIYRGLEKIVVDGITKDYLKIEYAGGSNLYILATGLDVLQKYTGNGGSQEGKGPRLNSLNSPEWKKTKSRVRAHVDTIAKDLVELYAKRQKYQGFAYGPDTVWQKEFEELFPYEETEDQLTAIEDTKRDMESTKIMDRLICGDVGFGKTEIAIRAAFKAVSDGKQVAMLVPTTILCQQHFATFRQRMKDFPISIEMLSRFRTPAEVKKIKERMAAGTLDIVIGTHKLLGKDIVFKDLGLLIVDEEQRFGVTHKEKIKKFKETIDVLTLSATPIPRTLHMSLAGIRDMSVLTEPPTDRMPIQTYVLEHNDEIIREAIMRELARDGQVYYVYNRIGNIDEITNRVAALVPDANVAFAHGQMSERELERIMFDFIHGDIDVLVSTTIIETGLDISNVNTIIIDDADRMGLSQLYQLRGRVGRSSRTAYAFLMYKRDKMLREVAEKRLAAIREFTELGSGFKIAMRDLEIRGAGNLLGESQSGHMEAVGYDLYVKMLNEAIRHLTGEAPEEADFETQMIIDVDAYIPAEYIPSEARKIDMYKRIADIRNGSDLMDLRDEMIDRYGDIPAPADNLMNIALLKAIAHRAGLAVVNLKADRLRLTPDKNAALDGNKITELLTLYKGSLRIQTGKEPYFEYRLKKMEGRLSEVRLVLDDFATKLEK